MVLLLLLLLLLLRGNRGGGDFFFSLFLGEGGIGMHWSRVPMVVWLMGCYVRFDILLARRSRLYVAGCSFFL